ncbi:MAG TPA: hypothetical protein VGY48_22700 [Vicinamibacterales bacterium]|jgi:hypothetical protein|nr:hypothetical protein [Vicinamibacterales bacterium]
MFFVRVFLVATTIFGLLAHFLARTSLPWWPDTAMIGATFGTFATLSAIQHRRDNQRFWKAIKVGWTALRHRIRVHRAQ